MNTLEKETIRRYRQVYPHDTLKMISQKTGIQITRVFRIMNGKPMKVREFEVFEKVINERCLSNKNTTELERLTRLAMTCLSVGELDHIIHLIDRKILNAQLKAKPSDYDMNENLIA